MEDRTELYRNVTDWFRGNMPGASSELNFGSPYELLVAVILSAQCTDKRVNMVTPELFRAFPTVHDMARADAEEILPYIRSISYPNSKAAHLSAMARKLVREYGGTVPADIDSLMSLPGVGRKTANVVASIIYDRPVIAVDTHVFRVAHRIGLSDGKTALAVEKDLESHISEEDRALAHHWLILHGRYVCTARKPSCDSCGLGVWCRERRRAKGAGTKGTTKTKQLKK